VSDVPPPAPTAQPLAPDAARPPLAHALPDQDAPRRRRRFRPDDDYTPPRTEGFLPRRMIRLACFAVITVCLFVASVVCILAVWDYASTDVAWRAAATLGIVTVAMAGFAVLNELFGAGPAADRGNYD